MFPQKQAICRHSFHFHSFKVFKETLFIKKITFIILKKKVIIVFVYYLEVLGGKKYIVWMRVGLMECEPALLG